MTYLLNNEVQIEDSSNLSAFSRLRITGTRLLGEYRYMYGVQTVTEFNDKTQGNGSVSTDIANNSVILQVSSANNDIAVRQTKQYHSYIAGTSNIAVISFVPCSPKTGVTQSVGLFDEFNGIFFRINQLIPEFVIRSSFNFSTNKEEFSQQINWNLDTLDGSKSKQNPSGILLDLSKAQIVIIDYQWLGLGRVRCGFNIDGKIIYCHEFNHANYSTETYIKQASLPCRYEIKNVANTSSNSILTTICSSVYCEGSDVFSGVVRTISTGNTNLSLTTATTPLCLLAVRLKNTLNGKPNRTKSIFDTCKITTNQDIQYKIVILPNSATSLNSASWSTVPGLGFNEYSTNAQINIPWYNSSNNYSVILDDFALGGGGTGINITNSSSNKSFDNRNISIYQNYDSTDSQILAVLAYKLTNDATPRAALTWIEEK